MKICIIGAGVSGMSLGRMLSSDFEVEILEKLPQVGGIARTKEVKVGDDIVPYHVNGGHCFASRYEDVLDFVFGEVLDKSQWNIRYRKARVLFRDKWISYPIEFATKEIDKIDSDFAFNMAQEMLSASYENGKNLEEWFENHFGKTLAKEYFIPYNTKIWGIEPKNMSSVWVCDEKQMKLPMPNKKEIYKSLIGDVECNFMHGVYHYPKAHNQNAFIDALSKGLNITLNYDVNSIEKVGEKWMINGEKSYDLIINTSPLDKLKDIIKLPDDMRSIFDKLKYNKVSNALYKTDGSVDFTWAYMPNPKIKFHRAINIGSFYDESLRPYCIVETIGEYDFDFFKKNVKDIGAFLTEPIDHNITDHAYVLFDLNYVDSKKSALGYLEQIGIIPHGRFGEWEYYNMDICIKRSIDLAKKLKENIFLNKNIV